MLFKMAPLLELIVITLGSSGTGTELSLSQTNVFPAMSRENV
jgi:hypothetical protein